MRTQHLLASFVLASAVLTAAPAVTNAQGDGQDDAKTRASERFQKGVELYEAGDIRAALIEFRRAHKIAPTYRLWFNIGQASAELREYVDAHDAFVRYLDEGGDQVKADRRKMVEREIARLKTYLAKLTLLVNVDRAEILIDGVVVGTSPQHKPLLVSAGRRSITVRRSGYTSWQRDVDLAGEDSMSLDVELVSLTPTPTRRDEIGDDHRLGARFWVAAGATVFLGAATGISALLTSRAENDYEQELARTPNTAEAIKDAADKVDRMALITDIGIGLTVAAAVTTIVFAVRGVPVEKPPQAGDVAVTVTPGGFALVGTF